MDISNFALAAQRFFDGIGKMSDAAYAPARILTDADFRRYGAKYAYKFVTEETFDRYISKGSFLLSSLNRFRQLEKQGDPAGDRFEGAAFCSYSVGGRQLTVSTISGFDTNIYSLARDLKQSDVMRNRFGSVVLRIRLRPFVDELARSLGAKKADVRLVQYADLKVHRGRLRVEDVKGFPPDLTAGLARALRSQGRLPSIFAKPCRFEDEREVRIAVKMPVDVPHQTVLLRPNLLRHVDRIS
jgi:hypothetical protein